MNITCLTTVERDIDLAAMQAAHGVALTIHDVRLIREDGPGAEITLSPADHGVYRITAYAEGDWVRIEEMDGADLTGDEEQFCCTLTAHVIGLVDEYAATGREA